MRFIFTLLFFTLNAHADLIINAAEVGIAKFHRKDNSVHPYADSNQWKVFVLADDVTAQTATPIIVKNTDRSVTVFFSSLDELLETVAKISKESGEKISVLNINAHGLPGGMWFPRDAEQKNTKECANWVEAASLDDQANYDQYYTATSKEEVMYYRDFSAKLDDHFPCTVTAADWQTMIEKNNAVKSALSSNAQVHLLSCIVGLGIRGETYTAAIAETLFTTENQRLESSLQFGLGDWSMPEGMGFWDYQSDEQINRDYIHYPKDRADRPMMQKGDIRVTSLQMNGGGLFSRAYAAAQSGLIKNTDFMLLTFDDRVASNIKPTAQAPVSNKTVSDSSTVSPYQKSSYKMRKNLTHSTIRLPHTGAIKVLK